MGIRRVLKSVDSPKIIKILVETLYVLLCWGATAQSWHNIQHQEHDDRLCNSFTHRDNIRELRNLGGRVVK